MRFLLDTDVCVSLLRGGAGTIEQKLTKEPVGEVGISVVTYSELLFGAENSAAPERNRDVLSEFLTPFEILDFPAAAARPYGLLRTYLSRSGRLIGAMDMLIAAHAVHIGATLVTNNVREFSRIPHLRIEKW
jgi:tRNA(fMet)-specific endonuclease VapC